jgi:outer membrane PBP1 activator LpoA protein
MSKSVNPRFAAAIALALVASLLTGCGTVTTRPAPASASAPVAAAFAGAAELARRDATLSGQARQDSRAQIDRLLDGIDNATLAREAAALPVGDPLYNFIGRALLGRGLTLPRPFDRENLSFDAGNRPPADSDGYRPPLKLAVLLPLTGDLAKAAIPVRDGLLAAYYGEHRRRPDILFYDTTGSPAGAIAAYGRAVAEGADAVVGPLGRDEVSALLHEHLTVPVLALNRGNIAPPAGSSSFSLAPEDDGIAAAEFLLSRNARHVLVLSDGGMQRAVSAFRDQLKGRGGVVSDTLVVADKPGDMSAALQASMQKPGGIDGVFLALNPAQARAIAPQLAAAGLASKPRVMTTSSVSTEGTGLDGIAFPSESWGVQSVPGLPSPDMAAKILPSTRGGGARLFAFGHDAWLLTAYMERLVTRADGNVQGATGVLRLDGFGNVMRTPAWSTYSNGTVVPLGGNP